MRVALAAGGLLAAGVAVLAGVSFLLFDPDRGGVLFALDLVQATGALAVALAVRGPLRRNPDLLAFLFLIGVLVVPLATVAVQPERLLLVGASLTLIPSVVALYVPWSPPVYAIWAAAFGVLVVLFAAWATGQGSLPGARAAELPAVVAIGIAFGALGQRLRYRRDRLAFDRESQQRRLSRQSRTQQVALRALNEELARSVRTDPLTGAGNRLRLDEDLVALGDRLKRYGRGFSLVMFDVDRFKPYNDRYGHIAGDDVLRLVVQTLAHAVRPADSVYRYGGEELLVVLPEQGAEGAIAAAERLRESVFEAAIPHEGNPPWGVLTVSAGIVVVSTGATPRWEDWIDRADDALYQAKDAGRNRCTLAADWPPTRRE